jgi:hypothetical protein
LLCVLIVIDLLSNLLCWWRWKIISCTKTLKCLLWQNTWCILLVLMVLILIVLCSHVIFWNLLWIAKLGVLAASSSNFFIYNRSEIIFTLTISSIMNCTTSCYILLLKIRLTQLLSFHLCIFLH